MMPATKKEQTSKAAAASKKNLEVWEKAQAEKSRISDNLSVFSEGFLVAAIPLSLVILYLLSV